MHWREKNKFKGPQLRCTVVSSAPLKLPDSNQNVKYLSGENFPVFPRRCPLFTLTSIFFFVFTLLCFIIKKMPLMGSIFQPLHSVVISTLHCYPSSTFQRPPSTFSSLSCSHNKQSLFFFCLLLVCHRLVLFRAMLSYVYHLTPKKTLTLQVIFSRWFDYSTLPNPIRISFGSITRTRSKSNNSKHLMERHQETHRCPQHNILHWWNLSDKMPITTAQQPQIIIVAEVCCRSSSSVSSS